MYSSRTPFLVLAGLSIITITAIVLGKRLISRQSRTLSKEELVAVLKSLCDAFVSILIEPAQCVQRADMLSSQRRPDHDSGFGMSEEEMAALLMQGGVGSRLEELQEKIFRDADVTQEEMQVAQETFSDDKDVLNLLQGLDDMLANYLDGGMPVHPLADPLNSDKITLAVLKNIVERKEERISELLSTNTNEWPTPSMIAELANIAKKAELEVCDENNIKHSSLVASVATGTNKSRAFRKNLVTLLFKHQCIPRVVDHRS